MKFKYLLFIYVTLAVQGIAVAQRTYHPTFDVGAKAGVTLSNQKFSPTVEQKMLTGMIGGLSVRYSEEKLFGLMAELNIEQRGWEESFDEAAFSYKRSLTYISLPVMTHINFGTKTVRGFVNLGPSVSYMIFNNISSNFDYKNTSVVPGFPTDRHVEQMGLEIKNKFDYGIVGGLGMELRFKNKHFFLLEGRYYFGLGNIFPSAKKDYFSASRGTSIEVTLSYMFRLKK